MARYLGVDYGGKHIGLALSDESETLASGIDTLENEGVAESVGRIAELVLERGVEGIVVGRPIGMKGNVTEETEEVDGFASDLSEAVDVEVIPFDERLTTKAAKVLGGKDEDIHSRSAVIILQNYLDQKKK